MTEALPGYVYDKEKKEYVNLRTGKVVKAAALLLLLRQLTQEAEARQQDIARAYYDGNIAPVSFVEQMRTEQQRLALAGAALAAGGVAMLDSATLSKVSLQLDDTFDRIVGTAHDVVDTKVTLPQLLSRVVAYAGVGAALYYAVRSDNLPQAPQGFTTIERRQLVQDGRNCDDCIRYYGLGWQLVNVLPVPTENCQCGLHCRCQIIQQDVPTAELDQWIGTRR